MTTRPRLVFLWDQRLAGRRSIALRRGNLRRPRPATFDPRHLDPFGVRHTVPAHALDLDRFALQHGYDPNVPSYACGCAPREHVFTCERCGDRCGYCFGCDDELPGYCDACWKKVIDARPPRFRASPIRISLVKPWSAYLMRAVRLRAAEITGTSLNLQLF